MEASLLCVNCAVRLAFGPVSAGGTMRRPIGGTLTTKNNKGDHIRRVGIVFAEGPAPGANAVIAAAASSFIEDQREVLGFFHGYSYLQEYGPGEKGRLPDQHCRILEERALRGLRNNRGMIIVTARANPCRGL